MTTPSLPTAATVRAGFAHWSVRLARLGVRDGSLRLGIGEGVLAGALCGLNEEIGIVSCTHLAGPAEAIATALAATGGVLATRGDRLLSTAVLVREASSIADGRAVRLQLGGLRLGLPPSGTIAAIAVREARGCRCGTQEFVGFYDGAGQPLLRLHRTNGTDADAFAAVLAAHAAPGAPRFAGTAAAVAPARLVSALEAQRLRAAWDEAPDGEALDALLDLRAAVAGCDRLRLLDAAGEARAWPVPTTALGGLLASACEPGHDGFVLRCGDGAELAMPGGGRHACEGREHLLLVEDLCLRLAHDGVGHARAVRRPAAEAAPRFGIELFDDQRRPLLALHPAGPAVAAPWSLAVARTGC